jgi:hypothetical protein
VNRRDVSRLIHDVGKYVARTARNLPAEPTREMIDMLIHDLYQLRPAQPASSVIAQLADFPDAPPLDDVRALFAEIDALEDDVSAGSIPAVKRAAQLACEIERRLRALSEAT